MSDIIYFDNAATTFPKPALVEQEINYAMRNCGNSGRSGHEISINSSEIIYRCRKAVGDFFGVSNSERVVFTLNTTHALNMAIAGLAQKGTNIIISDMEHNSVYRPVYDLYKKKKCSFSVFATGRTKKETVDSFEKSLRNNTRLAVITYASNICGKILPIKEISEICKSRKILLILDAAQGAGLRKIDFNDIGADVLCAPGHKGLFGPMGTGFFVAGDNVEITPVFSGGNGIESRSPETLNVFPEAYEPGTLNAVGINGLYGGIKYVETIGIDNIERKEKELDSYLNERLMKMNNVILYGTSTEKTPVTLFNIKSRHSEEIAGALSGEHICVRGGFHCAALAHKALNTPEHGAVRVSFSFNNTFDEIDRFLYVLSSI